MSSAAAMSTRLSKALARAMGDGYAVIAAYSSRASHFRLPPMRADAPLAGWRIFPVKDERFVVGYRFAVERERTLPAGLFDAYGELAVDPGSAKPSLIPLPELDQCAFVPSSDPKLTTLVRARSSEVAREFDPTVSDEGELVAYRPHGRATIRFAGASTPLWLRVSASASRFARVVANAQQASALEFDGGRFPRLLGVAAAQHGVAIEHCAGELLHSRLPESDRDVIDAIARGLAGLARADASGLPPHHGVDEAQQTAIALRRAARIHGPTFANVEDDLVRLFDAVSECEVPAPSPIHRDLHDKQIVLSTADGAPLRLLDTDTLAAGDPALDLANLLVHFELRELQGGLPRGRGRQLARALVESCRAANHVVSERRIRFFTACAWLRLAGVYALRSHGVPLIPDLLTQGRVALAAL